MLTGLLSEELPGSHLELHSGFGSELDGRRSGTHRGESESSAEVRGEGARRFGGLGLRQAGRAIVSGRSGEEREGRAGHVQR